MKINCRNCQATLFIRNCSCGRNYILTSSHTLIKKRDHTAQPIEEGEAEKVPTKLCDYCKAKEDGEPPFKVMNAGMRQKTCPKCNTETLSYYDL